MNLKAIILATALPMLGAPAITSCANTCRTPIVNQQALEEQSIRKSLDELMDSVYCIRSISNYVNTADPTDTERLVAHATLFAYRVDNGQTYLVTNNHAVTDPDEITTNGLDISPEGAISFSERTYRRTDSSFYIVNNSQDSNTADDIPLEILDANESLDIAIARAASVLHTTDVYTRGGITPEVGDHAYLVGCPAARSRATVDGIVANNEFDGEDGRRILLDLNGTFGSSGSPYFIEREGRLYWAGNINSVTLQPRAEVPLFTIGIPIELFTSMLDKSYM